MAARKAATTVPVVQAVGGKVAGTSTQYPTAVTCELIVNTYTANTVSKVAKSTATITAAPVTSTAFTTTTVSSTTTILPADAQIATIYVDKIAVTTSTTTTQTSTSTVTNTLTVVAPDVTYYAACASNNVTRTANRGTFDGLQVSGSVQPAYFSSQPDAYSCCVVCQTTAQCACAGFNDGTCTVYPVGGSAGTSGGTCSASHYFADFFEFGGGDPLTISNGVCGQFVYGMGACYRDNGGSC